MECCIEACAFCVTVAVCAAWDVAAVAAVEVCEVVELDPVAPEEWLEPDMPPDLKLPSAKRVVPAMANVTAHPLKMRSRLQNVGQSFIC